MDKKKDISEATVSIYQLLSEYDSEKRIKIMQAVQALLGDNIAESGKVPQGDDLDPGDVKNYFAQKDPQNKGEELAVAARYRELYEKVEEHSKEDLKKVITDARRNFDDKNFSRDINNAKRQAGFFNLNTGKGVSKLSYKGQNFVDNLPNRDVAKKFKHKKKAPSRKARKSIKKK